MFEKNLQKDIPRVHKDSYIHDTAVIIGKVKIGRNVFVGPSVIIRADELGSSITIHDNCNVQDGVVVHALSGTEVDIDKNTSLSHGCIVHGSCKVGQGCFIGFGAVVFNSILSDNVIIKHLAVVEGVKILSNKLVPNGAVIDSKVKTKGLKDMPKELRIFTHKVVKTNLGLAKGYKNMRLSKGRK